MILTPRSGILGVQRGFYARVAASTGEVIQELTNAQKLSLPANTAVGTKVKVSDGFVVDSSNSNGNGFYAQSGLQNGKSKYVKIGSDPTQNFIYWETGDDPQDWIAIVDGDVYWESTDNVSEPWLVTTWNDVNAGGLPTFTHPAVQQLASPSSAQGGVFVSGGTQDGIYSKRDTFGGKDEFRLLGIDGVPNDQTAEVVWTTIDAGNGSHIGWWITGQDTGVLFYSLSSVASPDLATNWKNASDDSPASITVGSITIGQIASGLKVGSTFYAVTTPTNGRNGYHDVLGVAADYTFDGTKWTNGTTNGSGNTAFPWDGGIGTRDDVCSETNWEIVP